MPVLVSPDGERLMVAQRIIKIFKSGRTQGEITQAVRELEDTSSADHRFVRALRTLLTRRCDFEVEAAVDPFQARKTVFEEAGRGPVLRREDRERVLRKAAEELGISVGQLEKALWADGEEELVLREFREIQAEELIKLYNTSLVQTMLFRASAMAVRVGEEHRDLIRRVKRLGLMYTAKRQHGSFLLRIDGPASVLKMTEKYGTSLAKLFPWIITLPPWSIKADIILRSWRVMGYKSPRILEFRIDDSKGHLFTSSRQSLPPPREFDSSVEEKFARSFTALRTEWSVKREPEPLVAGGRVFIPDFILERNQAKIYLEIVGFWTQEYLERKLQKLRELEKVDLILAVDRSLACSGFKELTDFFLIYYRKEVPIKEVMQVLNRIEEKEVREELRRIAKEELQLHEDVVDLDAMASERGVSYKAMSRAVSGAEGYVRVGRELVSLSKMKELEQKLLSFPREAMYEDVAGVVRKEGIKSVTGVLGHLGYEVRWGSLRADTLKVVRRE